MSSLKRVAMAWNIQIPQMSFVSLFPFHRCGWNAMNKIESFKLKLAQFVFIFCENFSFLTQSKTRMKTFLPNASPLRRGEWILKWNLLLNVLRRIEGKICRFLFPPREVESHLKRNVHCTSPSRMIKEAMNSVSFLAI